MKELSKTEWQHIYKRVPRLCIDLILCHKQKGIVLIKRGNNDSGPGVGTWHLPGKTILFGETMHEAINRIVENETGLQILLEKFLDYHVYPLGVAFGYTISLVFSAEVISGELHDHDGREIKYFQELPKNVGFGQEKIILDAGFPSFQQIYKL